MRPVSLSEQLRKFQHSATLLPKFSLILLQIASFKAIIEKTKHKVSAWNNVYSSTLFCRMPLIPNRGIWNSISKHHFLLVFGIITLVWERIVYAEKLHTILNESYQCITGSSRPSNGNNQFGLLGTILQGIRKAVSAKAECTWQTKDMRWCFMDTWQTWLTETTKNNLSC